MAIAQKNSRLALVHKFLHIDESIGRNMITIHGQSLLILPDSISTQVPGTRTQESHKIYEKLEHGNIPNTKKTGEGLIKKVNIMEEKVQNFKMKKKSKVNCFHCGLRLSSKRTLAQHIDRFHNQTRVTETKKFLEGDFKCLEVGCEGSPSNIGKHW